MLAVDVSRAVHLRSIQTFAKGEMLTGGSGSLADNRA
jgi:hypothetical protein